ncbi:GNAT superfamily N-acetyltransferase [Rhizobium aquaticum]|uniref:GNAT superfamily N-acetyltransferase n=1 Tax=Rhizobium aquaticum TaxID=1549636 RepID=A0ABV2IYG5_9HYPH
MEGLTFRQGYFSDAAALAALADLLRDTFGIDISVQNGFGGPDPSSMPFGYFDKTGRCVANFSVFTMPMMIGGREVKAAGYQSGAVRPEYRGRGLYRGLMKSALAWAAQTEHEAGILLTDKPALYEPYGFQIVDQFISVGSPPPVTDKKFGGRTLDILKSEDLQRIIQSLDRRKPVSKDFAVIRQKEMFLLNACLDRQTVLSHVPELDAIVAWKRRDDGTLVLLDIVAQQIPTMAEMCAALGWSGDRIEAHLPTDQLDWEAAKVHYRHGCELMLTENLKNKLSKGPMLSPMAEF